MFDREHIGVLGGMGPDATVTFYDKLINYAQKKGAKLMDDYPRITIASLPVPDMIAGNEERQIVLEELIVTAKHFEKMGVSLLTIPCNTAHTLLEEFSKSISIPVVSIIEATSQDIRKKNLKKILLLGTSTTVSENLYGHFLKKWGIEVIIPSPSDQTVVNTVIFNLVAGKVDLHDKNILVSLIESYMTLNIDGVILGCTELPYLISPQDCSCAVFDSLDILAKAAIEKCL